MKEFEDAIEALCPFLSIPDSFSFEGKDFEEGLFSSFELVEGKACFIDGGNQDILVSPHVRLSMVRGAASFFDGVKRVRLAKKDGFFLISSKGVSAFGDGVSGVDCSSLGNIKSIGKKDNEGSKNNLIFDENDDPVGGIRKALERDLVFDDSDFLMVRDGNLDDKGDIGICKTNSLLTDCGNSFVSLIFAKAPQGRWMYGPFAQDGDIKKYVVKFHPDSEYAFVCDVREGVDALNAFGILSMSARDPIFLGYPYGLIDADTHARISNLEIRYFKSKLYEKIKNVVDFEHNSDAHAILDSISF